jgi:hypothetical protein
MVRCLEVLLAIPDNEARTALSTLQRLGIGLQALERSDLYRCDVDDAAAPDLAATFGGLETLYNPNKHVLRVRESARPGPGEVWIDEIEPARERPSGEFVRIAGRTLCGVRSLERFTAWRLTATPGTPAADDVVTAATDMLLCNAAFQKAIRE